MYINFLGWMPEEDFFFSCLLIGTFKVLKIRWGVKGNLREEVASQTPQHAGLKGTDTPTFMSSWHSTATRGLLVGAEALLPHSNREHAGAGDTKTSSFLPGNRKCPPDGPPALEGWGNGVPVKFWAHFGHTRNRYLGRCLCTHHVTDLDSPENPHMGLGFLGNGFLN